MKVLVIRMSSLGDIVLCSGVVAYAKSKRPDIEFDFLTLEEFSSIVGRFEGVNKVIGVPRKLGFWAYAWWIKKNLGSYDLILDMHANIRSQMVGVIKFAPMVSYKKDSLRRRLFTWTRWFRQSLKKHVVERYAEILSQINVALPQKIESLRPKLSSTQSQKSEKSKVILHPFASHKTKTWPYFPELAERLLNSGHEVTVIGRGEFPQMQGLNLKTSQTNLLQMLDLISSHDLMVSTDSGPLHVAVAAGVQVVGIFGPTVEEFGFMPQFTRCTIIETMGLDCRPCHVHGLPECPKQHFRCMREISVERVFNEIESQLRLI